jgi:hypothetical protein
MRRRRSTPRRRRRNTPSKVGARARQRRDAHRRPSALQSFHQSHTHSSILYNTFELTISLLLVNTAWRLLGTMYLSRRLQGGTLSPRSGKLKTKNTHVRIGARTWISNETRRKGKRCAIGCIFIVLPCEMKGLRRLLAYPPRVWHKGCRSRRVRTNRNAQSSTNAMIKCICTRVNPESRVKSSCTTPFATPMIGPKKAEGAKIHFKG